MESRNALRSELKHRTFDSGCLFELQSLQLRGSEAIALLAIGLLLARFLMRDIKLLRSKACQPFAASELAVAIALPACSLLPTDLSLLCSNALTPPPGPQFFCFSATGSPPCASK